MTICIVAVTCISPYGLIEQLRILHFTGFLLIRIVIKYYNIIIFSKKTEYSKKKQVIILKECSLFMAKQGVGDFEGALFRTYF